MNYEQLAPFCTTPREAEVFSFLVQGMSQNKVAKQLGIHRKQIYEVIKQVTNKAAKRGYAPEFDRDTAVPLGFGANTSTQYKVDSNGNRQVSQQWVKTYRDEAALKEAMDAAVQAMMETVPPAVKSKPLPKKIRKAIDPNLCNLYVITDYHFGMKADGWDTQSENGDWDTHIAETTLLNWFRAAIDSAPNADTAILGQLGDFMHWDGLDAVTPMNKHVLDADDRFQKLIRLAIRVFRQVVDMLLEKHPSVHIIHAEGNHDLASSAWLREMFAEFYRNEPRVSVDTSPDPYYCYEWGDCSLFFHHGHKKRMHQIDDVFVGKFRDIFGRTKFSFAHMGHLHHDKVLETNLMTVQQHRTLAAKDSYAARGGWLSGRSASVITYHREFGKVAEVTISPEMLPTKD